MQVRLIVDELFRQAGVRNASPFVLCRRLGLDLILVAPAAIAGGEGALACLDGRDLLLMSEEKIVPETVGYFLVVWWLRSKGVPVDDAHAVAPLVAQELLSRVTGPISRVMRHVG